MKMKYTLNLPVPRAPPAAVGGPRLAGHQFPLSRIIYMPGCCQQSATVILEIHIPAQEVLF